MYLSQLVLDPRCAAVRRDLANPWELHRSLWSAFPSELASSDERVLWRLDHDRLGSARVLVQSQEQPNWQALATKFPGYTREPIACKPYAPLVTAGQVLRFRLVANCSAKRDGKRRAIAGEEAQLAWLERRGREAGFELRTVDARDEGTRVFRKGAQVVKLSIGQFDGTLVVTDAGRFLDAVRNGIGHSKGLGLGLLSIAPASH